MSHSTRKIEVHRLSADFRAATRIVTAALPNIADDQVSGSESEREGTERDEERSERPVGLHLPVALRWERGEGGGCTAIDTEINDN
jgi:hypothetical protein